MLFRSVSLAISLALQNTLSDIASGIIIWINRPFRVGDYIELGGDEGIVDEIGLIYTKLKTIDNKHIMIPNSDVASARVTDFSASENRRLDLNFMISYKDSIEQARQVILKSARDTGMVVEDPAPIVIVTDHTENGVRIQARIWVLRKDLLFLRSILLEEVKNKFEDVGITIPSRIVTVKIIEK